MKRGAQRGTGLLPLLALAALGAALFWVVRERSRIPRYSPEWTEHSASDPGITLVSLFVFLSEFLLGARGRSLARLLFDRDRWLP